MVTYYLFSFSQAVSTTAIKVLPYLKKIPIARSQAKKPGKIIKEKTTEQQFASSNSVPAHETQDSQIKRTINGNVLTLEGMVQGKPIRVRIFCEPVAESVTERK